MIGIYSGTILFIIGLIMTMILNRNAQVSMSGDFHDMPFRVKLGIILVVFGILLICISVMYVLITNPLELVG